MSSWRLERGACPTSNGVVFSVWAPKCRELAVEIEGQHHSLVPTDGVFAGEVAGFGPGTDYLFVLDGKTKRPDPVSRWQPQGVHGPSRVVDSESFGWTDSHWKGLPLEEMVFYELHVGAYTLAGTFTGIIDRLSHLKALGITALSLMPVAQFPGDRNWGYDGVYPYAPQESYGGPDGLKQLIDTCHQEGVAVVLDVVYNHLGPEGNYLAEYGHYFTDHYKTPWGPAINYDGPYSDWVRQYFIDNALYWLTEYHIDALRLDAIHAIYDFGAHHFLAELKTAFSAQAAALDRRAWLIAESDLNDVRVLNPTSKGGHALDAQWQDDFHHAVHTALTQNRAGYFVDFGAVADIAKAVTDGFVIDGCYSEFRKRHHGSSTRDRPGKQLVSFTQNHDQIANACDGERLSGELSIAAHKLAAALSVCSPSLTMLFMGEEWAADTPFYYFTSFEDLALAARVRKGRMQEAPGKPIDPQAHHTFAASCLNWEELGEEDHTEVFAFYRKLLGLRREIPALAALNKHETQVQYDEKAKWLTLIRNGQVALVCNLAKESQVVPLPKGDWTPCLTTSPEFTGPLFSPWQAVLLVQGSVPRSESTVEGVPPTGG